MKRVKRASLLWMASLVWGLAGCGGPPQPTPTPIPAEVVRPVQPTPVYPNQATIFTSATPQGTPVLVKPTPALAVPEQVVAERQASPIGEILPSALGIAPSGGAIYDAPNGALVKRVPSTGLLNVTGISADGRWLAVYDDESAYGWTPVGQLVLFGADDLTSVSQPSDPSVVATLIADVMQPVSVLDALMATLEAIPQPENEP